MTRLFNRRTLISLIVSLVLAFMTFAVQAETNEHYEACKTFGGEYEERRTDCNPDCKTTYICRMENGWSRVCDEHGDCKQVQDGAGAMASSPAETSQQDDGGWNGERYDSFEDCVDAARDYCRDDCDGEGGLDAVDCARSCLDGRCEEHDYGWSDSDGSGEDCQDCREVCEDACDRLLQAWRRDNCRSECDNRCDNLCN